MSIEDVKATIRAGNTAANAGKEILEQVSVDTMATEQLARYTVTGSGDEDAEDCVEKLAEAVRETGHTTTWFKRAVEHADAYLAKLG